jgi:hypothetical protein
MARGVVDRSGNIPILLAATAGVDSSLEGTDGSKE